MLRHYHFKAPIHTGSNCCGGLESSIDYSEFSIDFESVRAILSLSQLFGVCHSCSEFSVAVDGSFEMIMSLFCTCLDIPGIDALTRESGEKSTTTETENEEFYAGDDPQEAEDEQGISTQLDLIVQYGGDTSSDSDSTSIEDDWSDSDEGAEGGDSQQQVSIVKSK